MNIRMSSIKALGFFLILMTISCGTIAWYAQMEIRNRYELTVTEIHETEWILLRNSLSIYLDKAKTEGEYIVTQISSVIDLEFGGDKSEMAVSLENYYDPDNRIRKIVTSAIDGNSFNNINSNYTRPFIVRGDRIQSESSSLIAEGEFGTFRTFEEEAMTHANPELAMTSFSRIANADMENMNSSAIDRPILLQPMSSRMALSYIDDIGEECAAMTKGLSSYDLYGLEKYFYESGSWEETFGCITFVTPSYIFNREDLAGRPYVVNGKRTPYERLSVNIVFNFKSVIDNNPILKRDLEKISWREKEAYELYIKMERVIYLLLILLLLICTIGMKYTNHLTDIRRQDNGRSTEDLQP